MEREHASDEPFDSHNVFATSPRREFEYIVGGTVGDAPGRAGDASQGRDGWRLADFVRHPLCRAAALLMEEVAALRLYSGPMYVLYNNGVLRARARGKFVTTIHAINSGCLKLSRMQRACTVWRRGMLQELALRLGDISSPCGATDRRVVRARWLGAALGTPAANAPRALPEAGELPMLFRGLRCCPLNA